MRMRENWMKNIRVVLAWVMFLALIVLGFFAVGGKFTYILKKESIIDIRFLKTVSDADCIIISEGERGIMIDTGEKQDADMILKELELAGITTLDYLILSHPDKDHIGGALDIVKNISVSKVIQPSYDGESELLNEFNQYCKEKGISVFYPAHTWKVKSDYIKFIVYPSLEKHYSKSNNYSLAVLVEHGSVRMFFAGDAQKKRLDELLSMNLPEVDLYKVPHHGRANSSTQLMFDELKPTYAIVTAKGADREVLESSDEWGTIILYTREQNVVFQSDGQALTSIIEDNNRGQ